MAALNARAAAATCRGNTPGDVGGRLGRQRQAPDRRARRPSTSNRSMRSAAPDSRRWCCALRCRGAGARGVFQNSQRREVHRRDRREQDELLAIGAGGHGSTAFRSWRSASSAGREIPVIRSNTPLAFARQLRIAWWNFPDRRWRRCVNLLNAVEPRLPRQWPHHLSRSGAAGRGDEPLPLRLAR